MLTDYAPQGEGSDVHQPIPLPALAPHVERMHLNENCGFGEEYRVSLNDTLFSTIFIKPPSIDFIIITIVFFSHKS